MSPNIRAGIPRKQKTGDGYMNPYFLAHENFQDAHKSSQKSSKALNLEYTKSLAQKQILQKYGFPCTFCFV